MGSNWLLLPCLGASSATRDRHHADLPLKRPLQFLRLRLIWTQIVSGWGASGCTCSGALHLTFWEFHRSRPAPVGPIPSDTLTISALEQGESL